MGSETPYRQVRAVQTDRSLVVYQAYSPAIADAALAAGRFVAPFKRDRMTWIKPSLLWMAYRSGWATKPDQERVLAVEITRYGFEWALEHACLSHYEPATYADHDAWTARKSITPVRIQWDPERGLDHQPLDHRAIQVGLSGEAVDRYIDDWTVALTDVTELLHRVHGHVSARRLDDARALLPHETPYPLADALAATVGAPI
jgi:hypothetical protein